MDFKKDLRLVKMSLKCLPHHYTSGDPSRITLIYFLLSANNLLSEKLFIENSVLIDYIYAHMLTRDNKSIGFRGSFISGVAFDKNGSPQANIYEKEHIAMTYAAILSLLIAGDDLQKLDQKSILKNISTLQHPNGSFKPFDDSEEFDMRFVFCAVVICFIFNDFSFINVDSIVDFITKSQSYDYGFGQNINLESHGGSTYCALSSLKLLNKLDVINKPKTLLWCLNRQQDGFQGRINKPPDSCYTFWIGSSINILGGTEFVDTDALFGFLEGCHHEDLGGFGKHEESFPDAMHSYLTLAGLSSFGYPGVDKVKCEVNLCLKEFEKLKL